MNKSGLTKHEQQLEKIVEHIQFTTTSEGIAILKQFCKDAKFYRLVKDIKKWSDETFGKNRKNLPLPILYHLTKEVPEAIVSATFMNLYRGKKCRKRLLMELADCFMLVVDAASHSGFTPEELLKAVEKKLEINKIRKWGEPDENGTVEHIRKNDEKK